MFFEFATTHRIIFGRGVYEQIGQLITSFGNYPLLVTGAPPKITQIIFDILNKKTSHTEVLTVDCEPTVFSIQSGIDFARKNKIDTVVGLGGGSALDTAKTIAVLAPNPGDIIEYLEIIGGGKKPVFSALPCIAIPTTAGTGSEVTRNAVIGSPEHKVKVSLRGLEILPRLALVDPELTRELPPPITAFTGMDALTQLIEPFLSNASNPMTDAVCREGIQYASWALPRAFVDGNDMKAREAMSLASLLGGIALANARLGAVHGIAGPLGGAISAPHGAICAWFLPIVFEANYQLILARAPNHPILPRFNEISKLLTHDPNATVSQGINRLYKLREELSIPNLSYFGYTQSVFLRQIEKIQKSGSMRGNPVALSQEDISEILFKAL
jgi:alcohol dehydrogenase class IV